VTVALHHPTLVAALVAFALAAAGVQIARLVLLRLLRRLDFVGAANREAVQTRARQLTRAFTLLAYGVAALATASLALAHLGIGEARFDLREGGRWLATHGVNLVTIIAGAFVVVRAADLAIDHLQFKIGRRRAQTDLEWQRRAATLGGILTRLVTVVVVFLAVLMLLREMAIDAAPILTVVGGTAGIAAFAIGFGAQNLVRDVISGFFLILEDQVRVGDLARINGVAGSVEQVNLRTIVLRDHDGAVQVFPNGTITALANLSKQFSYATVDVRVAYDENLDRINGLIREAGEAMEHDAAWAPLLAAPLEMLGVHAIEDGGITLRVRFKALPLQQRKVENELRRRLVTTLVGRGIRPYAR
jgi:small conductance mechanosensitive channel